MALFGKKEIKNYIVFDPYTEEAVATCTTSDVKQILQVQPRAKFLECTLSELFRFKDYGVLPDDVAERRLLDAKAVK